MKHQRFREHGQLRGSELILTVVADDQMLDKGLHLVGEVRNLREFLLQHLELNNHVTQQLATAAVGERTRVAELVNFADVMQKCSGQQQVAIKLRVVSAHQVTGSKQRNYVVQQSANISMVQGFCGWRIAIGASDLWVSHERAHQRSEIRVLKRIDEAAESAPKFINVLRCLRKVVREVDLGIAQFSQFMNCDLKAVLIFVQQTLNF